jgi:hypothetical protein
MPQAVSADDFGNTDANTNTLRSASLNLFGFIETSCEVLDKQGLPRWKGRHQVHGGSRGDRW